MHPAPGHMTGISDAVAICTALYRIWYYRCTGLARGLPSLRSLKAFFGGQGHRVVVRRHRGSFAFFDILPALDLRQGPDLTSTAIQP
jgi:hypothetical protein